MTAALVDADGIVQNIIVLADDYDDPDIPESTFEPPEGFTMVGITADTPEYSIGWSWNGRRFKEPPKPPDPPEAVLRLAELQQKAADGTITDDEVLEASRLSLAAAVPT